MTTVSDAPRAGGAAAARSRRVPLLARPLTSYYLVTGSALLLAGLGLVMVLSASSVAAYTEVGSSFAVFRKQLMWVFLGLPIMWLAVRMPVRLIRALSCPCPARA